MAQTYLRLSAIVHYFLFIHVQQKASVVPFPVIQEVDEPLTEGAIK